MNLAFKFHPEYLACAIIPGICFSDFILFCCITASHSAGRYPKIPASLNKTPPETINTGMQTNFTQARTRRTTIFLLPLIALLLGAPTLAAQAIGHSTPTFTDAARNNRQIPTHIYYPATIAGDNTPIASGTFPLIVFGHGFVMVWSAYENFWTELVPEGYILVFPTTEGGFSPSHANFGQDMRFLLAEIQSKGAGMSVPASSVGASAAIMGHSMGGGAAFLAAADNPSVATLVTFAAANTNPSAFVAAPQVAAPSLLFSGSNDCITPPAAQQDMLYDFSGAACKTQVYITGGGHCYFADNNFNCSFGEATCSPSPAITRAEQQAATSELLKLWLGFFLKTDCNKAAAFQDSLALSTRITTRQNQSVACVSGTDDAFSDERDFKVFPNPFSNTIQLETASGAVYCQLFDALGQLVWAGKNIQQQDFSALPPGLYCLRLEGVDGCFRLVKSMISGN